MNRQSHVDFRRSLLHHVRLRARKLDFCRRRTDVFSRGGEPDALGRIYVINLDRRPDRWRRVRRELDRFRSRHGERLSMLTRRFSAVDARYLQYPPDPAVLVPQFTLADQLTVDPNPALRVDEETRAREIEMTRQEVAVALSHIEVWRLIADGDVPSALVLEDDVFMAYGFARGLETAWASLARDDIAQPDFDLLYLAFEQVGDNLAPAEGGRTRRLDGPGIWEASGYVLSRDGARKLLAQLPTYGPVDLWLNMLFSSLRAFTAARPLIEQRIDEPSTNSYSILPVLSQVGVITREKPLLPDARRLAGPVIAAGDQDSGLTALANALSMLGYTCCSDVDRLPADEELGLVRGTRGRRFNAYVNIGSLPPESLIRVARANRGARFIMTSSKQVVSDAVPGSTLVLAPDARDKWASLCDFLMLDYPTFPYPTDPDLGRRTVVQRTQSSSRGAIDLRADDGPWIVKADGEWNGITVCTPERSRRPHMCIGWQSGELLDEQAWEMRDDTFPSNMALFAPANVSQREGDVILTIREEQTPVRDLTSGAIATTTSYLYGSFRADLRPPAVPGVVTGMFLHRNGPRQEIDIEFLGKDTRKMLVNVYYNPGPEGARLEYGYRGTPTLIDLGFDAAEDFHAYEIEWQPEALRWLVDGEVVYKRAIWEPTPIPDRPLQFNLNLWQSRSSEFAGRLAQEQLPASARLRSISVHGYAQDLDGILAGASGGL